MASLSPISFLVPYHLWPIDMHALPLPALEPEYLLVEIIREGLGPCRTGRVQVSIQNLLQRFPVSDFLIASGLINQCDNAYMSKTAY